MDAGASLMLTPKTAAFTRRRCFCWRVPAPKRLAPTLYLGTTRTRQRGTWDAPCAKPGFPESKRCCGIPSPSAYQRRQKIETLRVSRCLGHYQTRLHSLPRWWHLRLLCFCGRRAQSQQGALAREIQIPVLSTYHPAARSWNYEPYREDILWTFRKARALFDA